MGSVYSRRRGVKCPALFFACWALEAQVRGSRSSDRHELPPQA